MILPEPPLPTLRQLVQAFFAKAPMTNALWYGTASEALAAATGNSVTVWFPAYFCNDALRFVRRRQVDLRFYEVQPDLGIDWNRLDEQLKSSRGKNTLVLVHYFGFPNSTETAIAFCRERTITLVEDAAHAVRKVPGIGRGDVVIFSPRKLLPVPSGGVLLANSAAENFIVRPAGKRGTPGIWSWAARRLIQRGLTSAGVPWHFLSGYRHPPFVESAVPPGESLSACSSYLRRLIEVAERPLPAVIAQRRAHYLHLLKACEGVDAIEPIFRTLPEGVCPYVFPVRVRKDPQRWVDFLRSKGIPASRWPDMPPEADATRFPESISLAQQTVLLPVHQSLTTAQVEKMGRIIQS